MSVSFTALLAGFSCKLYDDLYDNDSLSVFKNEILMELLKGIHYICFIIVSIDNPLWFIINYVGNIAHYLTNSEAFSKPYEKSLFFSFGLLFVLIDYNNIILPHLIETIIIIGLIGSMFIEPFFIKADYSLFKFIHRTCISLLFLLFLFIFPNMSNTLRYICLYSIGYFLLSACVQYYSLFIYNKDDIL
jgi:hypothetical protein